MWYWSNFGIHVTHHTYNFIWFCLIDGLLYFFIKLFCVLGFNVALLDDILLFGFEMLYSLGDLFAIRVGHFFPVAYIWISCRRPNFSIIFPSPSISKIHDKLWVGALSIPQWLATSLLHQESALDVPHILLSCLLSHWPNVWFICLICHSSLHALGWVTSPVHLSVFRKVMPCT